ncbi:MAG: hypothetical protein J6P03_05590, partial [Opitutales bacterium]|nr:hypothetical protein [Opitutales bacterium]
MRKTTFWIFTVFFAAAISQISAAEKMRMTPGDINDLELPSFDEKTGFKEWEVFGKNVKYVSDDQILIKEARLDIFSLNDSHKKNATFSSPRATLSRITKSAKSDAPLFVSGESFKLKGLDWKWSGVKRFVSLSKDVDVEFEGREEEGVKKIRIKSDYASMDYSGDENKFYFEKNVSVNGDDFSILSERLSTQAPKRSENSGFKSLNGISASGRVKMRYQSGISASAESVKVNPESGLANMEGNPEIVNEDTRDSVWGDKIVFKKSDSSAAAYSSADGKARARAIIHASADSPQKGELKPTAIFADTITMTRGKDSDVFLFAGNVVVENPEFKAFAKRLEAVSKKSEGGRQDILKISGFDGVKFLKDGQIAQADKIEIFPRNMEVWLNGGAKLEDPERGVRLFADRISMLHNDGRATAFSSSPKKPVRLEIDQSDSLGLEASPRPVAIT